MNDIPDKERWEAERLQRMLDEVTSDRHRDVSRNEPEAAGLREAWLAFGRLLEAAEAAQGGSWNPESIRREELRKTVVARRSRHFGAMAAAAAALVVALGLSWWLTRGGRPNGNGGPAVVHNDVKPDQPQQVAPNVPAPAVVHNEPNRPKQEGAVAKSSAWDDPIDTQITAVSQQIDSVRQTWQHRVDDADLVQYRIDDVSAGLSKDAL
jgi:hypothetical protein